MAEETPKKEVYFRKLPNGQLQFLTDETEDWTDLVHGKTTTTNANGEPRVWNAEVNKFVPILDKGDNFRMGMAAGYEAAVRAGERMGLYDEAEAQRKMMDNPIAPPNPEALPSPEFTEAQEKAQEGVLPAVGQILSNPLDYGAPMFLQSAPQMAVPLATGIAGAAMGAPLGPAGMVAGLGIGSGAGSFAVNYPSKFNEVQQQLATEQGINPSDPNYAVWANNPQVRSEVERRAMAYAAPVAGIDALAGGVGGAVGARAAAIARAAGAPAATLARAGTMGGNAARAAALADKSILGTVAGGAVAGTALDFGSEIAGQLSEQGRIYDPEGVAAEGLLGTPFNLAEIGSGYMLGRKAAQTRQEREVEQAARAELKNIAEARKQEGNPKSMVDYLTPDDSQRVFQYLEREGYTADEAATMDEVAFTKLALRLRASQQIVQPVNPNARTQQQNEFDEGVRQLRLRGLNPEQMSRYDPESIRKLGADMVRNQQQSSRANQQTPLAIEDQRMVIPPISFEEIDRQALDAQGLEAQAGEAAKIANAGVTYLKSLGWTDAAIARMPKGDIYRAGLEALRNPRMDAMLSPSRQLAAPKPEDVVNRVQEAEALKRQGFDPEAAKKRVEATGYADFTATSPEQVRVKGRFGPKRSDVFNRADMAAVRREEARLKKQAQEKAGDPSGLGEPPVAENPVAFGRTEAEQTVDAVRAFRNELNEAILNKASGSKVPPNYYKTALETVKARKKAKPKLSAGLLDFPTRNNRDLQQYNVGNQQVPGAVAEAVQAAQARQESTKQLSKDTRDATLKSLKDSLKRMGLENKVILNIVDTLGVGEGMVSKDPTGRNIITLALYPPEGRSIFSTLNHEVIHVLRNLGLITPAEWRMLEKAAKDGNWVDTYGLRTKEGYEGLSETELLEEAVAEHFAQTRFQKGEAEKDNPGLVDRLKKRIKKAFELLRNYLKELGLDTPIDVLEYFERIESGEIGSRTNPAPEFVKNRKNTYYSKSMLDNFRENLKKDRKRLTYKDAAPADAKAATRDMLEEGQRSIGMIGWAFRGLQDHAARIPALRPLFRISKDIEQTAHNIRTQAIKTLVPILNISRPERKILNNAMAILDANQMPLPPLTDEKGEWLNELTVTLKETNAVLGPKGTKVTLTKEMLPKLQEVQRLFRQLRTDYRLSTVTPLLEELMDGTGMDLTQSGLDMYNESFAQGTTPKSYTESMDRLMAEYDRNPNSLPVEQQAELMGKLNEVREIYKKAEEDTKVFYIPKVRQSPLFITIYDRNKPVTPKIGDRIKTTVVDQPNYERVATVNIPMGWFGRYPSKAAVEQFTQKIFEQIQKNVPGAFVGEPVDLSSLQSQEAMKFLGEAQFDTFEQLAMITELPGLDDKQKKAILKEFRSAWSAKGYEVYENKSQRLPGFIHEDNMDNYIVAAGSVYADRAARSIANNRYRNKLNEALTDIQRKAATGVLDTSVYNYAKDYREYINSPEEEFARLRGWMFNWYLGLNPSSAFLNSFQILHSSLPILTAMYGSPMKASAALGKYLVKNAFTKDSVINWRNPTNPDPYKDLMKELNYKGDLEKVELIQHLVNIGVLRPHTIEEMQARDVAEQLVGASKESIENTKDAMNATSNVFSFMFNRIEALTRATTAMAAYDLAKEAARNPATRARLEKYINSTAFAGADVTDAKRMAEIAVELTHPDTTKFNRAKAFRGILSVPTQFMAFPVKMLDMYITLLQNALGIKFKGDQISWEIKDINPNVRNAFTVLFLGLLFTSGLSGAVPFGEPAKDLVDKTSELITGINPDVSTQFRDQLVDWTGSPMLAEMFDKGFLRSLAGVDVSERMGVQMFSGVSGQVSLLDLLGPFGSTLGSFNDFHDRVEQGHNLLAVSQLMPVVARNLAKAYYANEYGLVTTKGNILPAPEYSWFDTTMQALGFTPSDVSRTREAQFARDRLPTRASVAKERAMDTLTTLRVRSILARKEGDATEATEAERKFVEYIRELQKENQGRKPENRVRIDMASVNKRVLQQLQAKQGRLYQRPINPAARQEAMRIDETYRFANFEDETSDE